MKILAREILINNFIIVLFGFLLGSLFIIFFKKLALRYNLLVSKGIPLIGGVAIGLSFLFTELFIFLGSGPLSKTVTGIIIASLIMLLFGLLDDWREQSIVVKFLAQIIATAFLVIFGIKTRIVYIGEPLNIIITFTWVIGITNAFNLLDIMDGLASGAAAILCFFLFIASFLRHDINSIILCLGLEGAIVSFLRYNLPPAKLYLGNSGSHFLGFVFAAIALVINYASLENKIALLCPLLILGLPIFDTAFLVLIRMLKKTLPFKKSNDHLAFKFLAMGYSKKKALSLMLGLCLYFCLCGIFVLNVSNIWSVFVVICALFVSLIVGIKMSRFNYA